MTTNVQYFEELELDNERSMGTFELTAAEIIEFGEQFDPLPFHTDPERAKESIFGGLIASGYHTTVETNRLLVENYFKTTSMRGALGIDELRWHRPVRPGDELSVTGRIVEKDDFNEVLGLGRGAVEVENQDDEAVLSMVGHLLFARRDGDM